MAIEINAELKPRNNKDFALINAKYIDFGDENKQRLDQVLTNVKNYPIVEATENAIDPDKYVVFGTVSELGVTLNEVDDGFTHEYCFEFTTADPFYGFVVTPEPKWANVPSIEENKTYQVSILRGIGVIIGA